MPAAKASTPQWEALLADLTRAHPEVVAGAMFGMPCAKVGGKAFIGSFAGGVVFKLADPARSEALALAGAELFDPSGQRPMREWVVVPEQHRSRWPALAEAARGYVGG